MVRGGDVADPSGANRRLDSLWYIKMFAIKKNSYRKYEAPGKWYGTRKSRRILRLVVEIVITLALAFLFAQGFCSQVTIQEGSMEPTLVTGESVLVDRVTKVLPFPGIRRGDLIVYRGTGMTDTSLHIKRVIGLPGETVEIRGGQIRVNGNLYNEVRELPSMVSGGVAEEGVVLGRDEYFVLGDNRNNSEDSRHSEIGNISKDHILGKAWLVISPFSKIRFL